MKLKTLSPSGYKEYDRCEWKWFLRYNLFLPDADMPSSVMGHAFHQVLEIMARLKMRNRCPNSKFWDWRRLMDVAINEHEKKKVPKEIYAKINFTKWRAIVRGTEELMASRYNPANCDVLMAEKWFKIPLAGEEWTTGGDHNLVLNGVIDRVDRISSDEIEIIDYKSGQRKEFVFGSKVSPKKELPDFFDDIQVRMYHLAAAEMFPDVQVFLVTIYYLVDGGPYTVAFTRDDLDATRHMIWKRKEEIIKNTDPSQNKGWWCNKFCHFGTTKSCEQIWRQKERFGLSFVTDLYGKKDRDTEGKKNVERL